MIDMKRSHWLFNCATPDSRYYTSRFLSKCRHLFIREDATFYNRLFHDADERLLYLARVEQVLQRERELQASRMCFFDPTRVKADQVIHMDCNVLRVWPDEGIEELIKFYTYKSELMRDFAAARWAMRDGHGAHQFKLARRRCDQALIKLKRERDRRKRVYNLS